MLTPCDTKLSLSAWGNRQGRCWLSDRVSTMARDMPSPAVIVMKILIGAVPMVAMTQSAANWRNNTHTHVDRRTAFPASLDQLGRHISIVTIIVIIIIHSNSYINTVTITLCREAPAQRLQNLPELIVYLKVHEGG